MMRNRARVLLVCLLVLAFATAVFLSLDINAHRKNLYVATLAKKPGSGQLSIVFYANRWSRYVGDGSITLASADWKVTEQSDSTVATARTDRATMTISSYGTPIYVSLLRIPDAGTAILTDGLGNHREIDLHADSESIYSFTVGGDASSVPAVAGRAFSPRAYYGVFGLIVAVLTLLGLYQSSPGADPRQRQTYRLTPIVEVLGYTAPLLVTPLIVQLAYWPASTAYDGGLQWMQAAVPGALSEALVIPATLLFRLVARSFGSPAYLIFAQIVMAAVGVTLILSEIRERGAPRWAAQLAAVAIALSPQYPTFFSTISKDAWNCIGVLFVAYFALSLLRRYDNDGRTKFLIALMGVAAVFTGVMRPNTTPAVFFFMLVMALFFRHKMETRFAASFFALYLGSAAMAPAAALYWSAEAEAARIADPSHHQPPTDGQAVGAAANLPLGVFANIYIFHLFSALVHSEVPIAADDAAVFYTIAPTTAWREYDCAYHDKTQIAVQAARLLDPAALSAYLADRQIDMAWIVLKSLLRHPDILAERQACVSRLLWYIGYDTVTFQANATLGYDSVPADFLAAVGENHSLVGDITRRLIAGYVAWSETWNHLWIFWKPFLFTALGLFSVLLYSTVRKRYDVLLVVTLPLMLTLSLVLLIPFPAFRYQYPATLLFMLLFLFSFAKPTNGSDNSKA